MSIKFTVADYLLTRLKQLGVTEIFQVPGDYVKHFTLALEKFKGIKTIGAINELDAAYAADAYGRTRGLGAVSLQYGVSTFSALNAIAGAYVERSPVVVISAVPGIKDRQISKMYNVLYHHSIGNLSADQELYKHVTVAADTLSTAIDAGKKIDRLLIAAITNKRPVYIACYSEIWGETCEQPSKEILQPEVVKSNLIMLENALEEAWGHIANAKSPLILAGVEVLRNGLSNLLQQLIDASGFLYTTTTLGKTVLDEDSHNFIGTYSDVAAVESVQQQMTNADCVLTFGAIITDDYLTFVQTKFAIMVLATTEQIRVGHTIYEYVTMKDFMEALLARFKKAPDYPFVVKAPLKPKYPEPWLSNSDAQWNNQPNVITYNRFFQHAIKFLADNQLFNEIVMTLGVSSSLYVATNAYGLSQNSFISSAAWQCIGFETGAAAGAQLGSGKRAWALAGDGGFMMVCQSLSTLARNQLDAVIFVFNNGVYAIEQVYVDINAFKKGETFNAFDILPKWDYMALANAFGALGYRVTTIDELTNLLQKLKSRGKQPILVEVVIPQKDLPDQIRRLGME